MPPSGRAQLEANGQGDPGDTLSRDQPSGVQGGAEWSRRGKQETIQYLLLFSLRSVSLRLSKSCTFRSHSDWKNPQEIVLACLKPAVSELMVKVQ